ncbi:MAG: polyphosphate kinase 1 [Saprospiraceae bacterium]
MTENLPTLERDISWLSFNERVLQEAKVRSVPLYERIKFLAIYSSNLDEFFRVRVASIRSFRKLAKSTRIAMDLKPRKLLKQIRQIVQDQQAEFGRVFREEILPSLESHGIYMIAKTQFNAEQKTFALEVFNQKIAPDMKWQFIDHEHPPFLENKALYIIASFKNDARLALVKVNTEATGRFIVLPAAGNLHFVAFVDDVIRLALPGIFKGLDIEGTYSVKLSRDAEMYIDDEYAGDLLEKIKDGLKERQVGLPTRFLYDAAMPAELLKKVKASFRLSKYDLIPGARYHNFNDFFGFPNPAGLQELHDDPLPPLPHPELEATERLLAALDEKDFLLHYPYQKFDYVLRLLEDAATDENVLSIKITLYRVASKSTVCEALLKAVENGKQVTVFIEAKARFDEETNLFWGEKLQQAGAVVKYSYPGIKVHSKLLLIARQTEHGLKNYAYLATGNFNEKTALLYADHALMTANPKLADEVAQVFDLLEGRLLVPKCKRILVAPFSLREGFEKLIDTEIANAKKGIGAWMIVKQNSLEDKQMMAKLVEASQAGVRIKMIVRGICCLQPGVEGFTENIEIISILDRFLEHARVYIFANGGDEKMYLASADWMGRNLDRRVEVAFPVLDESHRREIRQIIDFQWNDNVKARVVDAVNSNRYRERREGERAVRSQVETYVFLKKINA